MSPWKEKVILFAQYGSALAAKARQKGLNVMIEGFADRRYSDDLNLMSRSKPEAVHQNIGTMVDQVIDMVKNESIQTESSTQKIKVDTICIHGDHPQAVEIVKSLSSALKNEGIDIQ